MSVLLGIKEALDDFLELGLEFREASEAVEENGVDVGEGADYANGCVLLLVHDLEGEVDKEFGKHFENELGLKVLGGVGHDHRNGFLEAVEEALLFVALPEVDGQPVSDLLVVGGQVP